MRKSATTRHWKTVLLAALLIGACDDSKSGIGLGIPPGDGGLGLVDGPLTDAVAPPVGAGQVQIEILAPAAGTLLSTAMAPEIRARITSQARGGGLSNDPIAPDSVRFFIATDDPKAPSSTGTLSGPSFNSEYAGRADLAPLPTGQYRVVVTAATRAGAQGTSSLLVTVDAGPRITVFTPRNGGYYKGSVAVDFQVDTFPFEAGGAPEAFIGSVKLPIEAAEGPGRFRGVLEFNKFDPPLRGGQLLRVFASNKQGTQAEAAVTFFVDEHGPLLTATRPAKGELVGGVVRVSVTAADPAGVLGASVSAFIGNRTGEGFQLDLRAEPGSPGVYSALFDSRKLPTCPVLPSPIFCSVWPNLSFRASDLLGNETVLAYDIAIDNQPPLADLDPGWMRARKFDTGLNEYVCSHEFDPVGRHTGHLGDMPNDLCGIAQLVDLRALVEDDPNSGKGEKILPLAGVDPASVTAYVLDDTAQPLSVDTDGDGFCDGINPKLIPTTTPPRNSQEILAVRLAPIEVQGGADFTPDATLLNAGLACRPGRDPLHPPPLCTKQSLTLAMGYYSANAGPEPSVWAIEPIDDAWCIGSQFDAHTNNISDGWACIAVAARDRVGNTGVSAPLRVYISKNAAELRRDVNIACWQPPANAPPPPNCTGKYDRSSGSLVAGATCEPRRIPGTVRDY